MSQNYGYQYSTTTGVYFGGNYGGEIKVTNKPCPDVWCDEYDGWTSEPRVTLSIGYKDSVTLTHADARLMALAILGMTED